MYINPVVFGVLATLFIEMVVVLGTMIYCDWHTTHSKKHKGGKYNG